MLGWRAAGFHFHSIVTFVIWVASAVPIFTLFAARTGHPVMSRHGKRDIPSWDMRSLYSFSLLNLNTGRPEYTASTSCPNGNCQPFILASVFAPEHIGRFHMTKGPSRVVQLHLGHSRATSEVVPYASTCRLGESPSFANSSRMMRITSG